MPEEINIINNIESNNDTEELPIKKETRGRKKLPDELRKVYVPHPRVKKEKPPKIPKERKVKFERILEPRQREPLKPGRKKGMILKPERYNDDGTYNKKPIDKDYYKQYYQQFLKDSPCTCEICGIKLASKQQMRRHKKSLYCQEKHMLKDVPDFDTVFSSID
jgi:hypothetical protein